MSDSELYPNGEKVRNCSKCKRKIEFMEVALMSTMNKDKWVCKPCFEEQLDEQTKKRLNSEQMKLNI